MTEPLYPNVVAGYQENERGEDARALAERIVAADGGDLKVIQVEKGSPADVLRELAERGEASLIVLGSTHQAAFGVVAPGSVAENLLRGARCRLVIAPKGYARACTVAERGGDCEAEGLPIIRDQLRVVAVGFDGGAESRAALAEAAVLAQRSGASIRVIGVDTPAPVPVAGMAGAQGAETGAFQARLHEAAAQVPSELRALAIYERGDPVAKLIERAGEGVDLLVLGSRGFGPVLRLIAGSVSVRVIRNAPCPVMIVPRPPESAAPAP